MNKFELLETFCASQIENLEAAAPVTITWDDQLQLLWPEAQRFAPWRAVVYDASAESSAEEAILKRVEAGQWSRLPPSTGRVIASRLTQALAVIQTNALASDRPGVTMPSGMNATTLTSALLIYWCYAMKLPLTEIGGTAAGVA